MIRQHVIEPRVKEKKAKLSAHHENIKTILRKWNVVELKLSKTKSNFTDISIPLYTIVIDETKQYDQFNEVISHMKSRHYISTLEKLQQLDKLEKEYNQYIQCLIPKHEVRFVQLIQRVHDLEIFDIKNFLQVIFDYFHRLSIQEDVYLIEEGYQVDKNDPFFRYRLRLSYEKENTMIDTLNIKEQVVKDLRNAIDETASEIVNDLKSCNDKFNLVQRKYNEFRGELNKVVHDAEILGVYGNCIIEDQIKLIPKFIKFLKSLFRLKRSG